MKTMKKIVSLLLVLTMAVGLSLTAFAEEPAISPLAVQDNCELTVTGKQLLDKDVTIVPMFTTNIADGTDGAKLYGYKLVDAWQNFMNEQVTSKKGTNATTQEAYDYVSEMSHTQLIDFVKAAESYYEAHTQNFTEVIKTATAIAVVPADSKNPQAGKAEFTGLTSGYYLVMPDYATTTTGTTRGTHAMLVNISDAKPVNMVLKTDDPKVDKEIVLDGGNKSGSSAQIGEDVKFQLTATVPNMTDFDKYTFKFKDTLSKGLTLKQDTIEVTINGKPVTKETDYTVSTSNVDDGSNILTIDFKDLKALAKEKDFNAGDVVKIEYTATLNKDAQTGTVSNTNKAELEYSNDPSSDGTGTSTPSTTHTHSFEIKVHKYANADKDHQLAGAEFQLQNTDGSVIKLMKAAESDHEYRVATPDENTASKSVDHIITVAANDITIKGLKAGKYKLVETKAPDGYNKLTNPIEFEIKAEYGNDGSLTDGSPKYVVDGADQAGSSIIEVQNKSGALLPETGSIGTIGLTILGVLLVVGGLGFTSNKKKQQA